MTGAPGNSLCAQLRVVCERVCADLPPGAARKAISDVRARLEHDVLRVAVGGRLNAGKSTFVNALLGEKLAATDATECTTLVTWFSYGPVNLVRLRFRDGSELTLPAQPLWQAVATCGRPAAEIAVAEVECSNLVLAERYTVVDTPGLDALSGLDAMSLAALAQADVLLYLMPHPGENDREALKSLHATATDAGVTAINAIGVLSRIDQLGQGIGDPWPEARKQATRYAQSPGFTALLGDVVPVLGLLAETATGGSFTEADMHPLRELAAADQGVLDDALYSADDFLENPKLPIVTEDRQRLISLLGMYGISVSIEQVRGGVRGAARLLAELRERSGIRILLELLQRRFVAMSDPLRARTAIQALDAVSWRASTAAEATVLAKMRDELDAVRASPKLRQLDLATALAELSAGKWAASEQAAAQLVALATGTDLAAQLGAQGGITNRQARDQLAERITEWRTLENTGPRAAARHARAVREYLELLFLGLPSGDGASSG